MDLTPTNLPVQTTPFVGREEEIASASDLLRQPNTRLVTLIGTGGAGKTRLALDKPSLFTTLGAEVGLSA